MPAGFEHAEKARDVFIDRFRTIGPNGVTSDAATWWTRERIIAALRADAERRGHAPRCRDWYRHRGNVGIGDIASRPGRSTVIRIFGSWRAALEAAGLEPMPRKRYRKPRRAKGTWAQGERTRHAKLTADDVRELRRMRASGMVLRELAQHFDLHVSTVSEIASRKTWRHVRP